MERKLEKRLPTPDQISILEPVGYVETHRVPGRRNSNPLRMDLPEGIVDRFVAFAEDDDYLNMRDEIALLRSMLSQQLLAWKRWEQEAFEAKRMGVADIPEPPVSPRQISEAIDNIGKTIERQHRIETASSNIITVEAAIVFAVTIGALVNKFVKDAEERTAVMEGIRSIITAGNGFSLDMQVVRKLLNPVKIVDVETNNASD